MWITSMGNHGAVVGISECRHSNCSSSCNQALLNTTGLVPCHDDVIKWKHLPRYWPFVWEFADHRWIPCTLASDAELWCFLWSAPEWTLSTQTWGWWFETLSLRCHCDAPVSGGCFNHSFIVLLKLWASLTTLGTKEAQHFCSLTCWFILIKYEYLLHLILSFCTLMSRIVEILPFLRKH